MEEISLGLLKFNLREGKQTEKC